MKKEIRDKRAAEELGFIEAKFARSNSSAFKKLCRESMGWQLAHWPAAQSEIKMDLTGLAERWK